MSRSHAVTDAAIVTGSGAYLLSRLLRRPPVTAYMRGAGWLHNDDFGATVRAIHEAARAWERSLDLEHRENVGGYEIPGRCCGTLTVEQSAEELGLSPRRVQELARAGRITGRRVGRRWEISPASVRAYQQQRERK
jgi:excisionase family DNA binding protein